MDSESAAHSISVGEPPGPVAPLATPVPLAVPIVQTTPDRRGPGWWSAVAMVVVLLVTTVLGLAIIPELLTRWKLRDAQVAAEAQYLRRRAELKAESDQAQEQLDQLEQRVQLTSLGFRALARKVAPTVVHISNYQSMDEDAQPLRGFRPVFTDPLNQRKYHFVGAGSGVIIRPGVILTNYHVVKGADRLRVTFSSDRVHSFDAEPAMRFDKKTDLAILRVPKEIPPEVEEEMKNLAEFADSDRDVHVGDWALAMGSPLGLKQSVTQGVISAKGRMLSAPQQDLLDETSPQKSVPEYVELLQTDAAINPGNSGGPLYNQRGQIAGINVAIASDHPGIGFAIPSNKVKEIVQQLLEKGEVSRGYLGVALRDVEELEGRKMNLEKGAVMVLEVTAGQAAEKAGLKVGDVIVAVDNKALQAGAQAVRHFRQLIADTPPDSETALRVLRNMEMQDIKVVIGKRPANLR